MQDCADFVLVGHLRELGSGTTACTARAPPRDFCCPSSGLYVLFTGTIARVGRGLDPEARATLGLPGFEPGRAVTIAVMLPTAPLRPRSIVKYWPIIGTPGCTARAPPRGIFCSSSGPLRTFHWNHRAGGAGPRPRSQGRFEIAGIRTRTGSGVCSDVTNCATPAPAPPNERLDQG